MAIAKRNRAILEKTFPAAYVANGLNATQAYRAIKKGAKYSTARVEGSALLAKPAVRSAIQEIMEGNGMSVEDVQRIHLRNMKQTKQLSVSQTAVQDAYKLHQLAGFSRDTNNSPTQIAIIIDK